MLYLDCVAISSVSTFTFALIESPIHKVFLSTGLGAGTDDDEDAGAGTVGFFFGEEVRVGEEESFNFDVVSVFLFSFSDISTCLFLITNSSCWIEL